MTTTGDGPYLNLKAVVQQTGLKPDTLRAWERRYGLPTPERSSGGHRLYTRHDVDTLKWLIARQKEGLSIARAVDLWRQMESKGQDPLVSFGVGIAAAPPSQASQLQGQTLRELREEWISAGLAYDEPRSERALAQAFALYSPETVVLQLLQAAVSQIGNSWYHGEVTVQQEHFCTALATRRLEALIMASPAATRPGRILVACPPQEHHTFSPLILSYLLRRRGFEVLYLGANVPVERLEATLAETQPRLVIMAAQRQQSAAKLREAALLLHKEGVQIDYGGMIFNLLPALRARVPGHFLGERLEDVPKAVESLMATPRSVPQVEPVSETCAQAIAQFEAQQGRIEADVARALDTAKLDPRYVAIANRELANNIGSALALGDLQYLGTDIGWLKGLLDHHDFPDTILSEYLLSYHKAVEENMNGQETTLLNWLEAVIEENGYGGGN